VSQFDAGSLVVSACGYDSIPAEFGVIFNTQQFYAPLVPNSVDSYLVLEFVGHNIKGNLGTSISTVLGTANMVDLQKLRKSRPRRARPQVLSVNKSKYKQVHSMAWSGEIHWDCNYHTMQYYGMCLSLNSSVLAYWVINTVIFWRWESPFFSCSQCVLYVSLLVDCTVDTQISWVSLKAEHRKWSTATNVICWFFCWFDRS